ncbi:glycoside hydrolase family 16 protein [Postia placenta MAD-698-R-SB12]|uniref:Glycoside hydrolase family 16 protein n=1 Tax=Postia placenta MAD-698-R-SB12 TaxID=670580 RepID=A0A1X6MUF0_9APHY|nr:glycoside hydrolase family 16 protein [Postia placenta MAD-698-R-SB12]OSX60014.1 glycoside hydrolase family 16 protein [Postia placenta MAD-698-R-SB12]
MPPPQPSTSQAGRSDTTYGVATGTIGGGYGPYSYNPAAAANNGHYGSSRFSAAISETSVGTAGEKTVNTATPIVGSATVQPYPYLWDTKDPDLDDALHNPDPIRDAAIERSCTPFSLRGWLNVSALVILVGALLTLFAGYPIINYYEHPTPKSAGYNLGGINGSGQIPDLPHMRQLVDKDTPDSALKHTASDGSTYKLVFSDEFETPGRTFWPGDDPFWEAVDLNYWPTGDIEWYTPTVTTTENGKLVITMEEVENHNLNFRSSMLQTWNKFCFTTGYVEISVSLPGSHDAPGFWPAAWTMGNLGRAGYGATTQGTWPYSYDACDVGTFPNQTYANSTPAAADGLSIQPGQKLSACTCPGSDHPGPSVDVGRSAPEIDIFEAQIVPQGWRGQMSQSLQIAPFDLGYEFDNSSSVTTVYNDDITSINTYHGGQYQEAVSALTFINSSVYNNTEYGIYGYEWYSNPNDRDSGYVQWYSSGEPSWKVTSGSLPAEPSLEISQRLISEEPMYIIINFGMSPSFELQDWMHLQFPSKMYVDYVRVYQQEGAGDDAVSCDPPNYPTADYINNHLPAYSNPNYTTWSEAGYDFPRNRLYDGCS